LYRSMRGAVDSLKLADLVRRYHLQPELDDLSAIHCPVGRQNYHCALYDAIASALLLIYYCKELSKYRLLLSEVIGRSQGSPAKRQKIEQRELF